MCKIYIQFFSIKSTVLANIYLNLIIAENAILVYIIIMSDLVFS